MNKEFFKHNLHIIASNALEIQQNLQRLSLIESELMSIHNSFNSQVNEIKLAVCTSIGLFESENIHNDNVFTNYLQIVSPQGCSGFDNQTFILEEIKKMIIELKVKGSVRTRHNGLIELRTQCFGSIYGRTKEEIEDKLNKKIKEAETNKGKLNKNNATLLSEFYQTYYLPYKKANLAETSIKSIESTFKNFVNFDKPINKYSAIEIEQYLYSIPQTRTRQVMQGLLNNILKYAKRLGYIKQNPCENVEKMKHNKKIGRALSFQNQCTFFNSLYSPTSKATFTEKMYLTFVYLTGTRRNEALSITAKDIKFNSNTIHIPGTKTKTSDRIIPMFPLVKKLLLKMNYKDKVFDLTYNHIKKTMEKITNEFHLHELRHTFGTIGICVQKLDPKTVALYMGHNDPYTTLNTYTHPEQLNEALFYNGSFSEEQKQIKLYAEYEKVLQIISNFLDEI